MTTFNLRHLPIDYEDVLRIDAKTLSIVKTWDR